MQPGKYSARVLVNTSDGRQNIVTVTLTVVGDTPQQLDVSPPFLRFAGVISAPAAEQDLLVRNTGGGGPLPFSASVAGDAPWLSVTPTSGQAGPNAPGTLRVMVNAQGLPAGARRAAIHIDSAAGAADIPVSLLVRPAGPVIGLDVGGVRFEAREKNGSSGTQTANVLDLGSGAVNWQAEVVSAASWLSLGATRGQATPATASELSFSVQAIHPAPIRIRKGFSSSPEPAAPRRAHNRWACSPAARRPCLSRLRRTPRMAETGSRSLLPAAPPPPGPRRV
jgi:hypothetical protein